MHRFTLLIAIFLAAFPAGAATEAETLARGRALSTLFLEGKTDELWPQMTPAMHQGLGSAAALAKFREQVGAQLGEEVAVLDEQVTKAQGADVYLRTSRWSKLPQHIVIQWALDADDRIAGFFVRPAQDEPAPAKHADYQTKNELRLPFDGEWDVFWGGRTAAQNYHVVSRDQRFAYDILVLEGDKSHRGDGSSNEDYYCWDRPILAPADASVVAIVDGLPDQKPGTMDPANPPGNHVVLDLGEGEYAMLAHLRQGSLKVKPGDKLSAGQELGRCGNSGNTSEPHLHFHLQDEPKPGSGDGLPAFFVDYVANGKPVARGEPTKGQTIRN